MHAQAQERLRGSHEVYNSLICISNYNSRRISNQGTCIGGAEGNIDYLSSVNVLHCVIIPNLPVGLGN